MIKLTLLKQEAGLRAFQLYFPGIELGKNILCPFHEDKRTKSFGVYQKDGEYRFKCFGCGKQGDVIDHIKNIERIDTSMAIERLKEIVGNGKGRGKTETKKASRLLTRAEIKGLVIKENGKEYRFSRAHQYRAGNPRYVKVVYACTGGDKTARFYSPVDEINDLWVSGRQSKPVLYNQELLRERPGETVQYSESEHDSDILSAQGYLSVSGGGASAFSKDVAQVLKGRDVVIFPHNDEAGYRCRDTVAELLKGVAKSVKAIDLVKAWTTHLEEIEIKTGSDIADFCDRYREKHPDGDLRQVIEEMIQGAELVGDLEDKVDFKNDDIFPEVPFPFEAFPPGTLKHIYALSEALHVNPEIAGSVMLTLVSGAIGNSIRVSPKPGYQVALFLWLITIGRSGSGKSPLINTLMKPIEHLQAGAYKEYQLEMKEYETLMRDRTKQEQGVLYPERPKLKHYFVSDCTIEALSDVFLNDPRGTIICQDEISGLILGMNQYKAKGNDRQHYLTLFNCGSWKNDRKTGNKFIPHTGAAIIGGIQPRIMPRVFSEESFAAKVSVDSR